MALDNATMVKIKNRSSGTLVYKVRDLNVRRQFTPGEEKEVSFEELKRLSYEAGGMTIIKDYLIIKDKEVVDELIGNVEPEYFYTEKEVREILTKGSLDQLLDTLDYASPGVLDIIKKLAVELEIPDVRAREAIQKATGLNVTKAIEIKNVSTEENSVNEEETKQRRSTPIQVNEEKKTERRTATAFPEYNIIK